MSQIPLTFRQAVEKEVEELYIKWAHIEGWNMPVVDPQAYFLTFPEGWIVAEVERKPVGLLYTILYPSGIGHIGYIIVDKEQRGKGVGTRLIHQAFKILSTAKTIALYSAAEDVPFYNKLGFVKSNFTCIRMSRGHDKKEAVNEGETTLENGVTIRQFDAQRDMKLVMEMDEKLSGSLRPHFWELFGGKLPSRYCIVAEDREGHILGVGAIRPLAVHGFRLGPLYASSKKVAGVILNRLLAEEDEVSIDVPSNSVEAFQLAESFGFKKSTEAHHLVKGEGIHPSISEENVGKIWGVCSLDFN